jgi:hypothetical protein
MFAVCHRNQCGFDRQKMPKDFKLNSRTFSHDCDPHQVAGALTTQRMNPYRKFFILLGFNSHYAAGGEIQRENSYPFPATPTLGSPLQRRAEFTGGNHGLGG